MNLADYQNAAALARACVETGAGVDKDSLARAAQEMSAAVAEVNGRLRKAGPRCVIAISMRQFGFAISNRI